MLQNEKLCLCLVDVKYFLQFVALLAIAAEGAGAIWSEESLHINHVGSFSLQGDHIETLPHQVVSWYKGSGLALTAGPSHTGKNRGVVECKQKTQIEVD